MRKSENELAEEQLIVLELFTIKQAQKIRVFDGFVYVFIRPRTDVRDDAERTDL